MDLNEYLKETGIKVSHIANVCGIAEQTILRMKKGIKVNKETADKIRWFTNGKVEVPHTDRHTSRRMKTT